MGAKKGRSAWNALFGFGGQLFLSEPELGELESSETEPAEKALLDLAAERRSVAGWPAASS